jgi:hypothetical protein
MKSGGVALAFNLVEKVFPISDHTLIILPYLDEVTPRKFYTKPDVQSVVAI